MSMMDHYPTKKRRLVLSTKMTTRSYLNKERDPQRNSFDGEIVLPEKKHKSSPGNVSTDDSQVEIHWDNNSPSPSQALKPRRKGKQRKNKTNDLSMLIKQIPKSRRQEMMENSNLNNEDMFTTWMQQNLASSTRPAGYSFRKNVTRTSLGSRGSKEEALDFSEKVKQFLSQAPIGNNTPRIGATQLRSSPVMVTRSQRSQNASPNYFSNSSNDSFMINLDNNSDDSIIADLDTIAPSKTPIRSCRLTKGNHTPRLTRSTRKRPVPKFNATPCKKSINSTEIVLPVHDVRNEHKTDKHDTNNKQTTLTDLVKKENLIDIDFDDNDEVDDILASQPDILNVHHQVKTVNKASSTSMKTTRKNTSTPMPAKKKETMKTPEILSNNVIDDFDDILANFDMDEIRCKSQDIPAPARLTSDQRKLKTKCHTSPLPMNSCAKYKLDKTNSFVPITTGESSSSKKLDRGMKTLTINSPSNAKKTDFKAKFVKTLPTVSESQKSFVKDVMVTTACRKPFVPPKKNGASNTSFNRFPFELSAIEGKVGGTETADDSIAIQDSSNSYNPFSSTQKCTMEEIEQKRKYAQLKLRERLRRKRSK